MRRHSKSMIRITLDWWPLIRGFEDSCHLKSEMKFREDLLTCANKRATPFLNIPLMFSWSLNWNVTMIAKKKQGIPLIYWSSYRLFWECFDERNRHVHTNDIAYSGSDDGWDYYVTSNPWTISREETTLTTTRIRKSNRRSWKNGRSVLFWLVLLTKCCVPSRFHQRF